jgi:quercetin 2,3-dioxygenase
MDRRSVLQVLATAPVLGACRAESPRVDSAAPVATPDVVLGVEPLGFQWKTRDPFLFCVHHDDAYPAGNGDLGPAVSLAGRNMGSDFSAKDGFSMYHGDVVPGFPSHPHRGFETVTVVRRGLVDHSDSLGAAARYGQGDVQWLTAGNGIVHAEMFPLLESGRPNPLELFQIWLNLPSTDKLVAPHFSMLWNRTIPRHAVLDRKGLATEVAVIAGRIGPANAPSPPPKSWASRSENDVAIWTLKLAPGAEFTLPAARAGVNRTLYFFRGNEVRVGQRSVPARRAIELRAEAPAPLQNGAQESEFLLLQGRPIAEPVAQHGPFVMNTQAEIQKAYSDYRSTRFGGWPWPSSAPVHARDPRFARHADGRFERDPA